MKNRVILCLVLSILSSAVLFITGKSALGQTQSGPVRYHVEDLGGLPGSEGSTAAGINDKGDVVGWTSTGLTDGGNRAFIYKNGGWMVESEGAYMETPFTHAFLYTDG
jgi:probable HAF family extracellular repeat protein